MDGEVEPLGEHEAESQLAAFEDYWRADRDRRLNPNERERVDVLREEYGVLARRNWTKINAIHNDAVAFRERMSNALRAVLVALAVLVVVQVVLGFLTVRLLSEPVKGRRFAVGLSCAVESAVGRAGHDVLLSSAAGPGSPRFARNLERLGYPPEPVRKAHAKVEAQAYVQAISRAVEGEVGGKGASLIRPDGSLDCPRLIKLSHATR